MFLPCEKCGDVDATCGCRSRSELESRRFDVNTLLKRSAYYAQQAEAAHRDGLSSVAYVANLVSLANAYATMALALAHRR